MNMPFQFLLGNTPIKQTEAVALLAATGEYGQGPIEIELTKIFDLRKLDSQRLFELSVREQNQDLASLAWKISIQKSGEGQGNLSNRRSAPVVRNGAHAKVLKEGATTEELIEKLNAHSSYWSAGAALLLRSCSSDWVTLREAATDYVNMLWRNTSVRETCLAFKGFERNLNVGEWEPVDTAGSADRKRTFHVSPVYIGMREGLIWCRNHGLVEQEKAVSVGSLRDDAHTKAEYMQRVYYKVRATEKGSSMVNSWGDIDDYIDRVFASHNS
jgi:hypothetical protein